MADNQPTEQGSNAAREFAERARATQPGVVAEFLQFLMQNKKWWLLPIVLTLLAVALLLIIAGPAAPFIYPLF